MANVIWLYCLVINPVLWAVGELFDCLSLAESHNRYFGVEVLFDCTSALIDFVVLILLIWGSIRLRSLPTAGRSLLLTGFGIKVASTLLFFALNIALGVVSGLADASDTSTTPTEFTSVTVLGLLLLPVLLLQLGFDVVALVWLAFAQPARWRVLSTNDWR
jgi:hypothetical protein